MKITKAERYRRHAEYKRKRTADFAKYLIEIKNKPCVDCGRKFHHAAMEFDHRPNVDKKFKIGQGGTRSKDAVEKEIAKCDLVCSNCHRIRTKSRKSSNRRATKAVQYAVDFKIKNNVCQICKESFPYECLQFDHIQHNNKLFNIMLPPAGTTIQDIKREIKKCQIVCNCCHNIKTLNERQK